MIRRPGLFSAILSCALAAAGLAAAHQAKPAAGDGGFDKKAALAVSQAAVGRTLGDYTFRDTVGKRVALSDFAGRPVVINLVYTSCSHFCPVTVQNLARGVENAQQALGEDSFTVLTIGFDVRNDHPARMRAYQRAQDIGLANWFFLSADEKTVHDLTEDLGFLYYPAAQGFDHLAQTTILDAGGTIYRQVYGIDAGVREIVEPLKSLRLGQVSGLISLDEIVERIRLFCTLYDPATDAYRFDWSFFTGLGVGLLCIGLLAAFLISEEVRRRRAGRRA